MRAIYILTNEIRMGAAWTASTTPEEIAFEYEGDSECVLSQLSDARAIVDTESNAPVILGNNMHVVLGDSNAYKISMVYYIAHMEHVLYFVRRS